MSLRGSLDTFALPDVLALLAGTAKAGELHVTGASVDGRVWVDGGRIVAARTGTSNDVVDVLVALLRLDAGDFAFHADEVAPEPGSPLEVTAVLEQAEARLADWQEVERVLPSAGAVLTLAAAAPGAVRLTKEQWSAVAAIGGGRSVAELVEHLGGDELSGWRLLAGLVETGLAEVGEQPMVAPVRRTELAQQLSTLTVQSITEQDGLPEVEVEELDDVEDVEDVEETEQYESEDEAPEPVEAPVPAAANAAQTDPSDAVSRGTLLKFLSSVRS